jgi:gas vesicle protein
MYSRFNHSNNKNMNTTRVIVGATVGTALGVFLISKTGRKVMNDSYCMLKDKIDRIKGRTEDELNNLKMKVSEDIQDLGEDVKRQILDIIDQSVKSGKNIKNGIAKELHA